MERRLQKLKRDELLQILLEIEQENEQLVEENRQLKSRLAQQEVIISEAGSIAEASLKLSGVFEAAQEAADRYVSNVKRMYAQVGTSNASRSGGLYRCSTHCRTARIARKRHGNCRKSYRTGPATS